ncbi:hypothetical protein WICPIJ_002859 [Wickerhamomyces pijperi]|uniref:Uncharacterized protein n=1 Tax=Wickerhamomyces pijperi TaxID=599730 RepID=A0A9P8QAY0_WICPI|nr:hypothetical protein WICPIJ_002859 [Wickerhamomyces pijperi]
MIIPRIVAKAHGLRQFFKKKRMDATNLLCFLPTTSSEVKPTSVVIILVSVTLSILLMAAEGVPSVATVGAAAVEAAAASVTMAVDTAVSVAMPTAVPMALAATTAISEAVAMAEAITPVAAVAGLV